MEILSLIKEKLTDSAINKVSNFLGEHPDKISSALHSAVPTVLGSITQFATTDENTGKIMDILKDGGHTGEILDDLPNLLSNFDKTQLLITIGTNIFNHFSGNKSNGLVEKLASLNEIRKTSSASLLGLAAPLVLGAIGKIVAKEGLGISGLSKLLSDQKDSFIAALPPALASQLSLKHGESIPETQPQNTEKKTTKNSKSGTNWLIPLTLLAILTIGAFAYWWKYKRQVNTTPTTADSTAVSVLPKEDTTAQQDFTQAAVDTSNITASTNITTPTEKVETQKTEKVEPVKTEVIKPTENVSSGSLSGSVSENLNVVGSWFGLSNTDFGKNSAELRKSGDLDEVVKFLKKNRKAKIQIAGGSESSGRLAEDRAYAAWGYLLEKGVSENQMDVKASQVKDANGKVVIKVLKK